MEKTTTSPAHTPTPWHLLQTSMQCVIKARHPEIEGSLINIAATPGLNGNLIADAAFIVRACNSHEELLATLKNVLGLHGKGSREPLGDTTIDRIERVIAKVEA